MGEGETLEVVPIVMSSISVTSDHNLAYVGNIALLHRAMVRLIALSLTHEAAHSTRLIKWSTH